jgi:hypothetical protein
MGGAHWEFLRSSGPKCFNVVHLMVSRGPRCGRHNVRRMGLRGPNGGTLDVPAVMQA